MRQKSDHSRRHVLNAEHTTFQFDHLTPIELIGQKLRFLYRQLKKSVGILWDSRHVGRFLDTAADTDTAQIPLLRMKFGRASQFIEIMHALASGPQITCSWQIKCTRTHRQLGDVGSFPHKQNETVHGDPTKRASSVSAPGSNLRR
jgi:hypothetical protein